VKHEPLSEIKILGIPKREKYFLRQFIAVLEVMPFSG